MRFVFMLVAVLGLAVQGVFAQVEQPARVVDTVNVRAGAEATFPIITTIPARSTVTVMARNQRGNWVFVRYEDTEGWVASRFVYWDDGLPLASLPVSNTVLTVAIAPPQPLVSSAPQQGGETSSNAPALGVPQVNTEGMSETAAKLVAQLSNVPIIPTLSARTREIYRLGQSIGRSPYNFAKVGDCNTENQNFLGVFSRGNYQLGEYAYLQSTIAHYRTAEDSFSAQSMAGQTGILTTTVVDPIFADTIKCPHETLLGCEYRRQNASVSLVQFGMSESFRMDAATFRNSLEAIAFSSIDQHVVPVFFTFPAHAFANDNFEKMMLFNAIIVEVAQYYQVPVVNFWLAAQNLPSGGMEADRIHPTSNDSIPAHFASGAHQQHAFALWNLLALQVLERFKNL